MLLLLETGPRVKPLTVEVENNRTAKRDLILSIVQRYGIKRDIFVRKLLQCIYVPHLVKDAACDASTQICSAAKISLHFGYLPRLTYYLFLIEVGKRL